MTNRLSATPRRLGWLLASSLLLAAPGAALASLDPYDLTIWDTANTGSATALGLGGFTFNSDVADGDHPVNPSTLTTTGAFPGFGPGVVFTEDPANPLQAVVITTPEFGSNVEGMRGQMLATVSMGPMNIDLVLIFDLDPNQAGRDNRMYRVVAAATGNALTSGFYSIANEGTAPEAPTIAIFASGLVLMGLMRRRIRLKANP